MRMRVLAWSVGILSAAGWAADSAPKPVSVTPATLKPATVSASESTPQEFCDAGDDLVISARNGDGNCEPKIEACALPPDCTTRKDFKSGEPCISEGGCLRPDLRPSNSKEQAAHRFIQANGGQAAMFLGPQYRPAYSDPRNPAAVGHAYDLNLPRLSLPIGLPSIKIVSAGGFTYTSDPQVDWRVIGAPVPGLGSGNLVPAQQSPSKRP